MTHVYFYALHLRRQVLCHHKAAHHVTSHLFSHTLRCGYCKMADSRFEKSLDVSESSEESEAAEATNDETLAEYPQEVTSFAFVNQSKSNEARNYSDSYPFDAMLFSFHLVNEFFQNRASNFFAESLYSLIRSSILKVIHYYLSLFRPRCLLHSVLSSITSRRRPSCLSTRNQAISSFSSSVGFTWHNTLHITSQNHTCCNCLSKLTKRKGKSCPVSDLYM